MLTQHRQNELRKLLEHLGLEINTPKLLDQALTHSSYTFENKTSSLDNNERLEFLGDAVLKLIASRYLYERFPEYAEGELTKIRAILVSDNVIARLAKDLDLGKFLKIGFHEDKMGGRHRSSTLACTFEAMLGAFYLDGGIEPIYSALTGLLEGEVTEIDSSATKYNFKAMLQEYTQANSKGLPEYRVTEEKGPAHDKTFKIDVFVNEEPLGYGTGKSKKEAQQRAAEVALNSLGLLKEEEK